jgi:F0F1-type ATP synthase epsilon subunit
VVQSLGNHRVAIQNISVFTHSAEATEETDKEGITQTRFKRKTENENRSKQTKKQQQKLSTKTQLRTQRTISPDSGNKELFITSTFPLGHTPSTKIEK